MICITAIRLPHNYSICHNSRLSRYSHSKKLYKNEMKWINLKTLELVEEWECSCCTLADIAVFPYTTACMLWAVNIMQNRKVCWLAVEWWGAADALQIFPHAAASAEESGVQSRQNVWCIQRERHLWRSYMTIPLAPIINIRKTASLADKWAEFAYTWNTNDYSHNQLSLFSLPQEQSDILLGVYSDNSFFSFLYRDILWVLTGTWLCVE